MFDEEHSERTNPETGIELAMRAHWVALGVIAVLGAGGNAEWSRAALGGFGLLGPILIVAHHYSQERRPDRIRLPYLALLAPVFLLLTVFLLGLQHPVVTLQDQGQLQGKDPYPVWEMLAPAPADWLPVVVQFNAAFVAVLFAGGLYASAVNAAVAPRGRMVFARTWAMLAVTAGIAGLVGLGQRVTGATDLFWIIGTENQHLFSTFPHTSQWAAFAILWMAAGLAIVAWLVRQRTWQWLAGDGWVLLCAAGLLAATIVVAGEPLHWLLGALVAAVGCLTLAWQTWHARQKGEPLGVPAALCSMTAAALLIVAGVVAVLHFGGGWLTYGGTQVGYETRAGVLADSLAMWRARPWFGWGPDSFPIIYGFFQQADQLGDYWASPRSDLVQSLAENGVVGTLAWWLPALWMGVRLALARKIPSFLLGPLAALGAVLVLAVVDFPFSSPAVFFGFWFILFSVCRWTELDDEAPPAPRAGPPAARPQPVERPRLHASVTPRSPVVPREFTPAPETAPRD